MNDVLREQIQLNTKEVVVNVDNDHMKASIVLNGIGSDEAYTYEEIADKLSQAGVRTGINEARIREVILNKLYDIEIVVAEGKSAVNGTDGYYNFFFDSEYERDNKPTLREDGSVDYFNVKLFEKVNKDDKLAEYIEPTKGEFGYDIFGKLLVPKPGRPGPKLRGKGFTVSEDGKSYYAQLSGKVEYRNYDLNVMKGSVVPRHCLWTITARMECGSRLSVYSIRTVLGCCRMTDGWFPISWFKHCRTRILQYTVRVIRREVSNM